MSGLEASKEVEVSEVAPAISGDKQPDLPEPPPIDATSSSSTPIEVIPATSALGLITDPTDAPTASLETPQLPNPTPSPALRRPRPPTKGILKPPPPPAKPTLTNRLRDIATAVGGSAKSLFEPVDDDTTAGPSSAPASRAASSAGSEGQAPQSVTATVGGTLNAISGRLGIGFSRFVAAHAPASSTTSSPSGSPMPSRSISLPETGSQPPMSEKVRQKQPLRRATFLLPSLSITYPISSQGEPWSEKVLEDRKRVSYTTARRCYVANAG